jgi:ketosteroid isomerase-like protein
MTAVFMENSMNVSKQRAKISLAMFLLVLLTIVAAGPLPAHEGEAKQDESADSMLSDEARQVVDTLNHYAAAVQSANLQKIEEYMVTNAGFSSIEGTFTDIGWESYRDHLAPEMAMFANTQYQLSDIRPYVNGDMAYASFDYAMDVTIISDQFEGGEHPVSMRGKGTVVLVKDGEAWKIRHLHTVTKREETPDETTH